MPKIKITTSEILWAADWREDTDVPLPVEVELCPPNALAKATYFDRSVRFFVDLDHLCQEHRIDLGELLKRSADADRLRPVANVSRGPSCAV